MNLMYLGVMLRDLCSLYLVCSYLMFVNWCGCCELWFECESMFEFVSVEFENH